MLMTAYVWKKDRRTKHGERLVSTTVWGGHTAESVLSDIAAVFSGAQYRIEIINQGTFL